jgi:hypothetical protein
MSKPDAAQPAPAKPASNQKPIGLRLAKADVDRLDALVERAGPGVTTRHALAKVALIGGLVLLEKDFAKRFPPKK